jgi:fatty acid desaturase
VPKGLFVGWRQTVQEYGYNLDQKLVKQLSGLNALRTGLTVAFDWAVIAAAIVFAEWQGSWWALIAAWIVIGGRMHGLGVMIHDFAHYRFVKNKAVSDWVGDLFLAWPLLTFIGGYRQNHLAHHRYTNTEKDPDWTFKLGKLEFTFPQSWQYAVMNLLGYLVGVSSYRDLKGLMSRLSDDKDRPKGYQLKRFGYYIFFASSSPSPAPGPASSSTGPCRSSPSSCCSSTSARSPNISARWTTRPSSAHRAP